VLAARLLAIGPKENSAALSRGYCIVARLSRKVDAAAQEVAGRRCGGAVCGWGGGSTPAGVSKLAHDPKRRESVEVAEHRRSRACVGAQLEESRGEPGVVDCIPCFARSYVYRRDRERLADPKPTQHQRRDERPVTLVRPAVRSSASAGSRQPEVHVLIVDVQPTDAEYRRSGDHLLQRVEDVSRRNENPVAFP
jgi:hypothetical protein